MNKRYTLIITAVLFFLSFGVKAQTNLTQAVDFTVTDVNGNVYNLFDILSNGQHVCIDFFFDTCGPCQATSPHFKQTYQNFGCNDEDIFFIAIDVGDSDAEVIAYENTFLGGAPGYPSVSGLNGGGNAVNTTYGIGAYPTYILIRPDQTIIEQDMWPIANATTFTGFFANHNLLPVPCSTVGINDPQVSSNVTIYPNPAHDHLFIKADQPVIRYRLYNVIGGLVGEETNAADKNSFNQVDLTSLQKGIYVIELEFEKGFARYRFTKQ